MVRLVRLGLLVVLAIGCKKSAPEAPAAFRFLPATAESAIRLDMTRVRAWSGWAKAEPIAFKPLKPAIDAVKKTCDFDLVGDATSIVVARRGAGETGDMTLVIAGLPKDKVAACPVKLGASVPPLEVIPDGERFSLNVEGKAYASGAILPTGELVVVTRGSKAIDAAAWRDEVVNATGTAPAWWAELDQVQPIALRVADKDRTLTGSIELGDPFVLRVKDVAASDAIAQVDHARAKAVVEFLTKAEAGTGRLEPRELTLHGDFTATGPQIDKLVTAGLSAIGGSEDAPAAPEVTNNAPIDCAEVGTAVATYMATSLETMAPDQRIAAAPVLEKLVPALQKAYLTSCTEDKWPPAVIHCHVDFATQLPKFEKCRLLLGAEPRAHFDKLVTEALTSAK